MINDQVEVIVTSPDRNFVTPQLFDSVRFHFEGYRAIRIQTDVPGLEAIYGIASQSIETGGGDARYDAARSRSKKTSRPSSATS